MQFQAFICYDAFVSADTVSQQECYIIVEAGRRKNQFIYRLLLIAYDSDMCYYGLVNCS